MFGTKNKEEKLLRAAEKRQMEYASGQDAFNAASKPTDDQVMLAYEESRSDLLKWQQNLGDELDRLKHRLKNEVKTDDGWETKKIQIIANKCSKCKNHFVDRTSCDDCGSQEFKRVRALKDMPPLLNDFGIQMIETECEPLLSRNLINSNLTEDRILIMLKETSNTIADNLCDHYDFYDAEFLNFDHIMRLVKNVIIPAPFRALNDGERRHQRTMNKRVEAFTDSNIGSNSKKGFMQSLTGR